jgi:hypothetical protein
VKPGGAVGEFDGWSLPGQRLDCCNDASSSCLQWR